MSPLALTDFPAQTTNRLVEKTMERLIDNKNNRYLLAALVPCVVEVVKTL